MRSRTIDALGSVVALAISWFVIPATVNADVEPVISGNTYTFTVESGTETYATALTGAIKVVKEGAGILDLCTGTNTFTGGIEVNGGTLKGTYSALGGRGGTSPAHELVTVANGASLVIANTAGSGNTHALATELRVAGHGVNDEGAVQRIGGDSSLHGLFTNITMTDDTTFKAGTRWGLSGLSGDGASLDMGGNKLKTVGVSNSFEFYNDKINVTNPGEIEVVSGTFLMQCILTGGVGSMTLDDNTKLRFWGVGSPLLWPIDVPARATLSAGNGAVRSRNILAGNVTFGNKLTVEVESGIFMTIAGGLEGPGEIFKMGQGTLYVTGKVDRTMGAFTLTNGTVVLENAGTFFVTNRSDGTDGYLPANAAACVGGVWSSIPCLKVTGDSIFAMPRSEDNTKQAAKKHHFFVGSLSSTAASTFGILDIQPGAVVSNDLNIGRAPNCIGAVYLNGGKLFWRAGGKNQGWIGHAGVGFMAINEGSEFVSEGLITMGKTGKSDGKGGVGIVHQRGGTARMGSSGAKALRIARESNSYGHWYQTGGTFDGADHAALCWADGDLKQNNVEGVLTLSGANTSMSFIDDRYIRLYVGTNKYVHTGIVNINNGAKLTVRKMYKDVGYGTQTTLFSDASFLAEVVNSKFYVNFDGGVLIPKQYGTFFNFGSTGSNLNDDPDRVTVYAGGAIIDTSLANADTRITSWNVPLKKPSGNVLLSVSLPTDASFVNKYIAPPRVIISGVNTHGATAVAEIDEANQRLTGITVTSPGNDVPDDITVTIKSGDMSKEFNCPFTVGAPAKDGGLTKRGDNILDLNMPGTTPNTYEGPTVVEGGTLKFSNKTYPEVSPLVLKGGTVAFVGHAYTIPSIEGYGEITGSGGVTVTNELRITCADLFGEHRTINAQKITLGNDVRLVVTDPENLASYKSAGTAAFLTASTSLSGNAPSLDLDASYGSWTCVKSGNSLKFGVQDGTMVIFK